MILFVKKLSGINCKRILENSCNRGRLLMIQIIEILIYFYLNKHGLKEL